MSRNLNSTCVHNYKKIFSFFYISLKRLDVSLHKKIKFPISLVNVTKSAVSCEFDHIYTILNTKLHFLFIVLSLSETYLDSITSFDGDNLEIPGYNLINAKHP